VGPAAAWALVAAWTPSCGPPQPLNVVVIVLDTVRPDMLSAYGYPSPTSPFLETFAAQGTRFDRAYSTSSWTLPAHGSLFTGTLPRTHLANQKRRRVTDTLPMLAERLRDAGYQTVAFSGNVWVSTGTDLSRGFEHFEPLSAAFYPAYIRRLAADPAGKAIPPEKHYIARRVRQFLDEERDPARPLFLFVLLVEPHLPYLPHWKAARHFMETLQDRWDAIHRFYPEAVDSVTFRHYGGENPLKEGEWAQLRSMYEGSLRVVDELAASMVAGVDQSLDPGKTLIFILSDHGENLGDHGHRSHIFNLYDTNLRIPLLARGPGFRPGSRDQRMVQITDLYPTILAAAGLRAGSQVVGFDLHGDLPEDRVVSGELDYLSVSLAMFRKAKIDLWRLDPYRKSLTAVIGPRYKLIAGSDGSEELYDLDADPEEREPLAPDAVDAGALARLRAEVPKRTEASETAPAATWTDEQREALKALGYVRDD
jgi:arylsulfatase A-like enzyme